MRTEPQNNDAMFSELIAEIQRQAEALGRAARTREFWIYSALVVVLLLMAVAIVRLAAGFDSLTRGQLGLSLSCRTGEGQLATIIIGFFVFIMACVFTLGEVTHWIEQTRLSRAPGRQRMRIDARRPLIAVAGTLAVGIGGYALLSTWCA